MRVRLFNHELLDIEDLPTIILQPILNNSRNYQWMILIMPRTSAMEGSIGDLERAFSILKESERSCFMDDILKEFNVIGESYESLTVSVYDVQFEARRGRKRPQQSPTQPSAGCSIDVIDAEKQQSLQSFLDSPRFFTEVLSMEMEVRSWMSSSFESQIVIVEL